VLRTRHPDPRAAVEALIGPIAEFRVVEQDAQNMAAE
jgi:hypothetical protein